VPGCFFFQLSSCFLRFARNFFSESESLDFALGLQLPCECCGFPFTGSYPGQQRFFFFSAMRMRFAEVTTRSPNDKVVCVEGIFSARNAKIAQRCLCSEESAHAVNASAGRCRRRAEIDAFDRSSIHVPVRPQEDLQRSGRSTADVSADKVCILAFEIGRRAHVASENALVEPRRKPLDLRFDPRQHVEG
jgi:hypothetical protein